ncbi:MAG TPA: DUF485 domain-containing protein [Candidatus Baltobacteraceae bacterium]|nr:DUF485 domain-containing protein [Candidatus Baltobacteraceae bacterium]
MQHHHLTAREWDKLAADPQFQELLRARRRFVIPATIFFLLFYLSLPLGIAIAPATMREPVFGALTVAYALGLLQFAMAWGVLFLYMSKAKAFDARAEAIAQRAREEFAS